MSDIAAPNDDRLARALGSLVRTELGLPRADRVVIAIAGESGSGKSVTATTLAGELDATGIVTIVLHQDDYFLLPPRTNHEHRVHDLRNVGPHEDLADLCARPAVARRSPAQRAPTARQRTCSPRCASASA